MVGPISPSAAKELQISLIPNEVFECVNELIAKNLKGKRSTVLQKELLVLICKRMRVRSETVFKNNWLEFEDHYRKAGWKVSYDSPGYCESYDASFEFVAK